MSLFSCLRPRIAEPNRSLVTPPPPRDVAGLIEPLEHRRLLSTSTAYSYVQGMENPAPGVGAYWSGYQLSATNPSVSLTLTGLAEHTHQSVTFRVAAGNGGYTPGDSDWFTVTADGTEIHASDATQTDLFIAHIGDFEIDDDPTLVVTFTANTLEAGDYIDIIDTFVQIATPQVSVAAYDGTATEDDPLDVGIFRFTRTGAPDDVKLDVEYALTGSATRGTDYTGPTGSFSFGVGETVKDIDLTAVDDAIDELNETAIATVIDGDNYVASGNSANIAIQNVTWTYTFDKALYAMDAGATVTIKGTLFKNGVASHDQSVMYNLVAAHPGDTVTAVTAIAASAGKYTGDLTAGARANNTSHSFEAIVKGNVVGRATVDIDA